ncbi:unnamed protein product [Phytophthora lilii]|uniref:Unnamed protein product n=1 Tax=Phytophthora lilii TaxID=2077276 RepID=A0A9W6WX82_9STRA|nr:unnamed protein product [Phytophthora lilii]
MLSNERELNPVTGPVTVPDLQVVEAPLSLTLSELAILWETLEVLFTTERVLLDEYLEAVIPLLYGCFILMVTRLPSAPYHTGLSRITAENAFATVKSVFLYAALEFISFLLVISENLYAGGDFRGFAHGDNMIVPSTHALSGPFILKSQSPRTDSRTGSYLGNEHNWKLPGWAHRIVSLWFSLQLSHHGGRYSVERMIALDEYSRNTSIWRVLMVCFCTPLPMIILVLSQEAVPLHDPDIGWRANYGIWIRSAVLGAVVTHGIGVHAVYMLDGVVLSSIQLAALALVVGGSYVCVLMIIAAQWTFPIPFMGISCSLALVSLLVGWFRIVAGAEICRRIMAAPSLLIKFTGFVSTQLVMALVYPVYQVLFDYNFESNFVLPILLLLPVIKLAMKNMLTKTIDHLEDLMPESVIYTVDFFNSLYVATCMQSATSSTTVAAIMAIDFAQSAVELYEMHRATRGIQTRLSMAIDTINTRDDVLADIRDLGERFLETRKTIPSDITIKSCLHACYTVSKHARSITSLAREEYKATQNSPAVSSCLPKPIQKSPVSIHPTEVSTSHKVSKTRKSSGRTSSKTSSSGAFTALQLKALRQTLEVLFTSECIILTEYLEFIIPMLYGSFMLVVVNFPSAKYHTELDNVTRETVGDTVKSLFLYSLLELISFVVLMIMMRRNCGMKGSLSLGIRARNSNAIHSRQAAHLDSYDVGISSSRIAPDSAIALLQDQSHSPRVRRTDLHMYTNKLVQFWLSLQLSHHGGEYSIERLIALDEYVQRASLLRVVMNCLGTPLPMIIITAVQEVIPLQDPSDRWIINYGFWIRCALLVGVLTNAMGIHSVSMIGGLQLSGLQLLRLDLIVASSIVMVGMSVAAQWTFPIPFVQISLNSAFIVVVILSFRGIIGREAFQQTMATKSTTTGLLSVVRGLCGNPRKLKRQSRIRVYSCMPHRLSLKGSGLLTSLQEPEGKTSDNYQGDNSRMFRFLKIESDDLGGKEVMSFEHVLHKTLEVLFNSECLLLAENLEAVIPLLYGNYMLLMVHLPNTQYHTELEGNSQENVRSTVYTVFSYAILEFFSFATLVMLLQRNSRMKALYQLAFVLETHMPLVQTKLMSWVLVTLSYRVVQFGCGKRVGCKHIVEV